MPKHIKSTINIFFENQNKISWQINLLKNWHTIIGKLNSKVQLEKINNDNIVLGVYDSCWMQELYLLSNLIIDKINSKLDQPRIKSIRFKQVNKKLILDIQKKSFKLKKLINIQPSAEEIFALKKIKDPDLSESLKNFLIKCYEQKNG